MAHLRSVLMASLDCRNCGFESRWGHECSSLVCVVYVAATATGWSLVQREPYRVCVCVCVCLIECEQETSTKRWHKPDLGCHGTENDRLHLYREIITLNVRNVINTRVYKYNVCQTVLYFNATTDGKCSYKRITTTKSPSFWITFSASLTDITPLLPQTRDYRCYVNRPILASPPVWLQKHTDLRALFRLVTSA